MGRVGGIPTQFQVMWEQFPQKWAICPCQRNAIGRLAHARAKEMRMLKDASIPLEFIMNAGSTRYEHVLQNQTD